MTNNSRRSKAIRVVGIFFLVMAVVFFGLFLNSLRTAANERQSFEELSNTMESSTTEFSEDRTARLKSLAAKNGDLVAWLSIDGTPLSYPVMCTPDDPEHYLKRDFDGESSNSGVPFLGEDCTVDSDNVIVYGHNMRDGSMFASLLKYAEQSYLSDHPIVRFDTLEGPGKFEVIAAFRETVGDGEDSSAFRYYEYGGRLSKKRFAEFVSKAKERSLVTADADASYGDQLLTLSTCSYHAKDGRFVVVAKRTE